MRSLLEAAVAPHTGKIIKNWYIST